MAPAFYRLDELGFSKFSGQGAVGVPQELEDEAQRGAEECPEGAIRLLD